MCTTGVLRLEDGSHLLFKNKDFGRSHLDDRICIDGDVFGVLGMTTWAGDDPDKDEFSGFSIGANRHGLLCCDSNVVTLDGLVNYDVMVEVALREGVDVTSAAEAVRRACAADATSWGNLVMIDSSGAASVEIRGTTVEVVPLTGPTARTNHHIVLGNHELQEDKTTTDKRFTSAQRRVSTAKTLEDVFTLQSAHDDGPTGVCNHDLHTTVYSYVLHCIGSEVDLYVLQGQPCSGATRVKVQIPLGGGYSESAVREFLSGYPTANKENFAASV